MCEHVSGKPVATGKPGMERVSKASGEGGIRGCHGAAEGRK